MSYPGIDVSRIESLSVASVARELSINIASMDLEIEVAITRNDNLNASRNPSLKTCKNALDTR